LTHNLFIKIINVEQLGRDKIKTVDMRNLKTNFI
jgi:hypothetical protein